MPRRRRSVQDSGDAPAEKKSCTTDGDIKGSLQWEIERDVRKWAKFTDKQNQILTDAWYKKKYTVNIDVAPQMTMKLQLNTMIEKNKRTGYERRIRVAVLDKSDNEFYIWQWKDEHEKWNPYSAEVTLQLEEAREKNQPEVKFEVFSRPYAVNLPKMEQVNLATNVVRSVVRIQSDADTADVPSTSSKTEINVKEEESVDEELGGKGSQTRKSARKSGKKGENIDDEKTSAKSSKKREEEIEEDEEEAIAVKSSAKSRKNGGKSDNRGAETKSIVRNVVLNKGSAPVDMECPLLEKCHVYEAGKTIWDCMLNQTNVGNNNNKYYIIQLLEENTNKNFYVWQRWGRVGYKGQTNLVSCGGDLGKAKEVFIKKFKDKTGNNWSNKDCFCKIGGKYDLLHMDYSAKEEDQVDAGTTQNDEDATKLPDSKLPQKVQDLIKLICDIKSMEEAVIEMKYDAKKAPLGKLTKAQIKAGYEALKDIETLINKKDFSSRLTEACSIFYTRIPHDFGMRPPAVIRSPQEVKEKLQLLEALEDIEYAIKMLKTGDKSENPVDRHYHALKCELHPLEHTADDFKMIEAYLHLTHASTHNQYKMKLLDVYSVEKYNEKENFIDYGNRMLLWHGSRLTNWAGILGQGLRIAPPEAPVTGYMFGKGVYFADMSSKSANYCFASKQKNVGLILLCEVSLGNINDKLNADYTADKLPKGKHSVRGCGSVGPDFSTHKTLPDGTVVPIGKETGTGVKNPAGYTLNYNEFIVYDTRQIKMRYLVKVQFDFK